jgi:hypothetical protein
MLNGVAMAPDYALIVKAIPKKQRRKWHHSKIPDTVDPLDRMPERKVVKLLFK